MSVALAPAPARRPVTNPPRYLLALESRVLWERAALAWMQPALRRVPRGDGHHVVVLPGFNTSDLSTRPLRRYLRALGYVPHGWGLGRNLGPTAKVVDGLEALMSSVLAQSGGPVSLIGWSLGGLYARDIARHTPESVRYVATLGSPFRMRASDSTSASRFAQRYTRRWEPLEMPPPEEERDRLAVPTTAIYSQSDGFTRWQLCIDDATDLAENLEVYSSHMGLVYNPTVMFALADRLAAVSEGGEWAPFSPSNLLSPLYPPPLSWVG